MKLHPLVGYVAGLLLLVACFLPWVTIESRGVVVSGMDAGGTSFGKPGSGHLFFLFFLNLVKDKISLRSCRKLGWINLRLLNLFLWFFTLF